MPTRAPFHRPLGWHAPAPKQRDPFYTTREWRDLRAVVLKRDGYRCTWIIHDHRCIERAVLVDHIVPRTEGGPDVEDNLRSLCRGCDAVRHSEKGRGRG